MVFIPFPMRKFFSPGDDTHYRQVILKDKRRTDWTPNIKVVLLRMNLSWVYKDQQGLQDDVDRKKAEPMPALPLKTNGLKRMLFSALLFKINHETFKDDGDADDSF